MEGDLVILRAEASCSEAGQSQNCLCVPDAVWPWRDRAGEEECRIHTTEALETDRGEGERCKRGESWGGGGRHTLWSDAVEVVTSPLIESQSSCRSLGERKREEEEEEGLPTVPSSSLPPSLLSSSKVTGK